jgi:molecular chaperone GrpE
MPEEKEQTPEELEAERDEYLDLAQRARAELENYRKRVAGETAAAERRGRAAIVREVLPALDSLERALLAAGIDPSPVETSGEQPSREVSAADAFAEGVALVFRELQLALTRAGISEHDPTGERFDPNHHEAVATRPEDGAETGTIVETVQRGYLIDDHAIRPPRVIVAE